MLQELKRENKVKKIDLKNEVKKQKDFLKERENLLKSMEEQQKGRKMAEVRENEEVLQILKNV